MSMDETMSFEVEREKNVKTKEILTKVYQALEEKGYNPINQMWDIYYQEILHI